MPTPADMAHVEHMRGEGVLFDLSDADYQNIVQACTISIIACSDCDCTPEYERHLCRSIGMRPGSSECQGIFRPHRHFRHAGPLRFASKHLLGHSGDKATRMVDDLTEEVDEAFTLKVPTAIVCVPHFPCGKARVHGHTTLESVLSLYMHAAMFVQETYGHRAQLFHHIHIVKEGKMRTYGINVLKLQAFKQQSMAMLQAS